MAKRKRKEKNNRQLVKIMGGITGNGLCFFCQKPVNLEHFSVEHVIHKSQSKSAGLLACSHKYCNNLSGNIAQIAFEYNYIRPFKRKLIARALADSRNTLDRAYFSELYFVRTNQKFLFSLCTNENNSTED